MKEATTTGKNGKKKIAIMALKRGYKSWSPQVYPIMEQAIMENDIEKPQQNDFERMI
jgi:hypothetical protein